MKKKTPEQLQSLREKTRLVAAGRDSSDSYGFVNPAIVRGSTVIYPTMADFMQRKARYSYGTEGNPTTDALETAINAMEKGAGCVLLSSGLLACSFPFLAFAKKGDHVLVPDSVYRPTRNFCEGMLKRLGIETQYYDPLIGADIAGLMRPNTSIVLTEAPGSQTFEMQDIPAIVAAAHAGGALVFMDNTWATPIFFNAHAHGVDISIQAGTKFFAGHSDVLTGSVSARTPEQYRAMRTAWREMGCIIAPEDAFLTLRGIRSLPMRLRESEKAGLEMARWFAARQEVSRVLYPPLESDPGHALWKRDFTGGTGLFSVVLKPVSLEAVAAMLDHLDLFGMGASWGGYESLSLPFDCRPYRTVTTPNYEGPTIRFQIGLEDLEDLKDDLDRGFKRLRATR